VSNGRASAPSGAPAALVGRIDEQAAIDAVLDAARSGLSQVLVLAGEAGVGKTALLGDTVRRAADLRVLTVSGIESEAGLGHAALHRLLLPHLDRVDGLPPPQRDALSAAFGLVSGDPPDPFLVGLATLTLLSGLATEAPLLCVVDDAHGLDPESLAVLAFVGRRLLADGVALLFGLRRTALDASVLADLPSRTVEGLDVVAATELLRSCVRGFVDDAVARRLAEETLGNPLAIVELAGELTARQLAGAEELPSALPLGGALEERFLRQIREQPAPVQLLVLLVAAEPDAGEALVAEAAALLGGPDLTPGSLAAGGLVVLDGSVRFRHPLIRSAVLRGAPPDELRRVHTALATVLGRGPEPDRRAWHLAEAATGPDEAIAEDVEATARRTILRGGYAAAAALLDRAGRLSPRSEDRGRRLLAAAEAHLAAGNIRRGRAVLEDAQPDLDGDLLAAQALRLDGALRLADGEIPGVGSRLVQAALTLAPHDPPAARDTLLDASSAALYGGYESRRAAMAEVARANATLPPPAAGTRTSGDLLLDAFAVLFTEGHRAAAPLLQASVTATLEDDTAGREALRWLGFACWAAGAVGDNDRLVEAASRLVALSRAWGALGELTRGLYFLGMGELVRGDLATAGAHFVEGRELMANRGTSTSPGEAIAAAWRGDDATARRLAAEVALDADARGQAGVVMYTDHALAVLELGLGRYDAALAAARRVDEEDSFFLSSVGLPDLVEAAERAGAGQVARDACRRCAERAEANRTPLALGLAARARAVLAGDDAEPLHEEAIARLGETTAVGHLARARLLYGEWLRRRQRRLDAREQLRAAHDAFVAMGALAFADRAGSELEATGEHARPRSVETADDLTPQEAKVAALAAQRATNGEIAAQLFISPATVDYHLRKVFRKLGVRSRRDLAGALARPD
jgi:DNA-binding CsgD family transcriptional regulator